MKKTNRVIGLILSVFMLMQMIPGAVFAAGKTKLNAPANVKLAYDEGYEDYVYTFDAKVPSDEDAYEYAACVGGSINGRVVLSAPNRFEFEPKFLKKDIENDFSYWKNDMGVSDCEMLIGFLVVAEDENYADSDITVVDAKANIKNVNASFGGKCSGGAYWTYSNGTLTYFGGGKAYSGMSDVNENDVDTIIFESDIESVGDFFSIYNFPNVKNLYFLGTDTAAEDFLNQAPRTVAVFAHKNSAAYNLLINAGDRDDNGFYGQRIVCLDIDSADENYKTAPTNADAVKIISDCGIIPQIYSMYNKNVTKAALAEALVRLDESTLYIDRDTQKYTDLKAGTFTNGCVNQTSKWIAPKSETEFGANDEITYGELKTALEAFTSGFTAVPSVAQKIGLDGKNAQDKMTFDDLALILLNLATFDFNPENEEGTCMYSPVNNLFKGSVSTRFEDNKWIATLNGKMTVMAPEVYTEDVENKDFDINDSDLFGIDDDEITLFVDSDTVLSGYYSTYDIVKDGKVYKADFTINDGAAETDSKTVSLKLSAEGFTKYSVNGGEFKTITSSPVSYTLGSKHGEQSVSVTFANDDNSKTRVITKTIMLNNLHKVIYMADGKEFASAMVGCGLEIPALDSVPQKEGYAFDKWENLPEIMPDGDITVNAIFVEEPPIASGVCGESAKWSLSKNGTLYISGTGLVTGFRNEHYDMVKAVVISDGITGIDDYALGDLYNCESVKIGKDVKKLGKYFMYGSKIKEIVLGVNVEEICEDFCGNKQSTLEKIYVYNKNLKGCEFIYGNSSFAPEAMLYGYSDSTLAAVAQEKNYPFTSIDPDFEINGGEKETTSKDAKITFNKYAKDDFKQYKLGDGEYKNIDAEVINYVFDSADGEKTISITFKNDSYTITKTHTIIFNNKHKITYVSDGKNIAEEIVGCGAKIVPEVKNPEKEGYTFLKWDIPEIMPDNDVTANAIFAKNADDTELSSILTDEEKADGKVVKSTVTVADENENIELALVNKYSKYAGSIMVNIDITKGKDDAFEPVTETKNLISFAIDIPSEIQGKKEYIVLREHNGEVDALTVRPNSDGEYIEVKDGKVIIYANKFSTYMLAARVKSSDDGDEARKPSNYGGGSGSGSASNLSVKFVTNGGSAVKTISAAKDTYVTEPEQPVKEGFIFEGWYTDKNFATKFDFNTKITKSITLYAKWVEKAKTSIILTIGQKDAAIDGKTVSNDVAPKIVNDRTMLPIRFIAEALGAKVDWIEESQTVKITSDGIEISLVIGEDFATVNGEKIDLDSPSFIENDRTYLPIRFVSEKLGADVKWDDATQTVNITK